MNLFSQTVKSQFHKEYLLLATVKRHLLEQQKKWEEKLQLLSGEDPQTNVVPEAFDFGDRSWQDDVQRTKTALKDEISKLLWTVRYALMRLEEGMYGVCEKCKKRIEEERLRILPTTTLCLGCK